MKSYLVHLLKFNRGANAEVVRILKSMGETERKADRKAFAKSLHGLLSHIAGGELFLQAQLRSAAVPAAALNHAYSERKLVFGEENFPDFEDLAKAIAAFDDANVAFAEALDDAAFETKCSVMTPKGKMEVNVAWVVIQIITHGVHHRGQISQVLDELGIPNDYSGIKPVY